MRNVRISLMRGNVAVVEAMVMIIGRGDCTNLWEKEEGIDKKKNKRSTKCSTRAAGDI